MNAKATIPEGYTEVEGNRRCYRCRHPLTAFERTNEHGSPAGPPRYHLPCAQCSPTHATGIVHRDIPERYRQWRLADYSDEIADAVKGFLAGNVWCLCLHGRPGTKKSSIAAATLIRWRSQAGTPQGAFVPMVVFAEAARGPGRRLAVQAWRKAAFLVLDDIGSSRDTPGLTESLVNLLCHRYDHKLKTVLTSNLDPDALARHVDERAASRIHEGVVLDLGDRDIRLELAGVGAT